MCNAALNVKNNLFDLSVVKKEEWFTDFKLVFDDDGFSWSSNKILFAAKNRYFREKLAKENTINIEHGHLIKFKKTTMELVKQYFLYGTVDLKENLLESVLRFSEIIKERNLTKLCTSYLSNNMDEKNFSKTWSLAATLKLESLKKMAKNYAVTNFKKIYYGKHFLNMEKKFVEEILRSETLNTDSEEIVFFFLKNWVEHNTSSRRRYSKSLISLIHIKNLNDEFTKKYLVPFYEKYKISDYKTFVEFTKDSPRKNVLSNIEQFEKNFDQMIVGIEFLELSYNELSHILKSDRVNKRSSNLLYSCLEKWVNYDADNRRMYSACLLKEINLDNLSIELILEKFDESQLNNENKILWESLKDNLKRIIDNDSNVLDARKFGKHTLLATGDRHDNNAAKIEIFNHESKKWEEYFDTKLKLQLFTSVLLKNKLLIIGGRHEGNKITDEVWSFDFATKKLIQLPKLNTKRWAHTVNVIDDSVFICGGYDGSHVLNSVEMWTPGWNTWKNCKPMSVSREQFAAAQWKNKLYVFGGHTGFGKLTDSVEFYDLKIDKWSQVSRLIKPLGLMTAALLKDYIYIMGGKYQDEQISDSIFMYDPQVDRWTASFNLPQPLLCLSSTTLNDRIFISGGLDAKSYASTTVYVFDPTTGKCETHSSLTNKRFYHTMLAIPDTLIYPDDLNTCKRNE